MTLTEMRMVLAERGIRLTRSMGQTFLFDRNQLRRIVSSGEVCKTDRCLEIGPGLGPLTELLVEAAGEVVAIEKDRRLMEYLRERFAGRANLTLIEGDALEYLRRGNLDLQGWKVVANLPYSVASPILVELAQHPAAPNAIVVTVQLEVAQRLMAGPGSPDYGVLSVFVQAWFRPATWFKIPASCFYPEPKVDSACIRLDKRESELVRRNSRGCFARLVKLAFAQRRKMMFKVLKTLWEPNQLEHAFDLLALDRKVRAEDVSVEQFASLANLLMTQDNVVESDVSHPGGSPDLRPCSRPPTVPE
ncbi:MAG: 16S rRNA (adenine(1518)-N(6)/adenine(1519)-N(6))-dimethyltransferase RsmA [Verrucomicrobiae bacterium]|nr:16S rRNA (adenine(1518)-N(6)/adenine(1519)-N(6))-dimethyltransferase RsmA [Verrucomicrobiae bacterium]